MFPSDGFSNEILFPLMNIMFNVFFVISVKDIDEGLDRDIFDINEGLWIFLHSFL